MVSKQQVANVVSQHLPRPGTEIQVQDVRKRVPKDIAVAAATTINDGLALLVEEGLLEEIPRASTAARRRFRVIDPASAQQEIDVEVIRRSPETNGNIEGIELGRIASALERIARVLEAHE